MTLLHSRYIWPGWAGSEPGFDTRRSYLATLLNQRNGIRARLCGFGHQVSIRGSLREQLPFETAAGGLLRASLDH